MRILLVDDHPLVIDGYHLVLANEPDLEVVGELLDGLRVEAAVDELGADAVLLDLSLPGKSGFDLLPSLRRLRVVVVSAHADAAYVNRALELGASGYVAKCDPSREVVAALRAQSLPYLSPSVSLRGADVVADPYDSLSDRERQVLRLLASGSTTAEIAGRMGMSIRWVEDQRRRTRHKLGVRNQAELVRLMVRRHAFDPDQV